MHCRTFPDQLLLLTDILITFTGRNRLPQLCRKLQWAMFQAEMGPYLKTLRRKKQTIRKMSKKKKKSQSKGVKRISDVQSFEHKWRVLQSYPVACHSFSSSEGTHLWLFGCVGWPAVHANCSSSENLSQLRLGHAYSRGYS